MTYNIADMIEYIEPGPSLDEFRVELPRAYFEADDLDVYEFRLLAHYSQRGPGYGKQGTRAIAKACKMSISKVSESRASLVTKGYLTVDENVTTYGTLNVSVVSKWGVRTANKVLKDSLNNTCSHSEHPTKKHQYLSAWVEKYGPFKNEDQAFTIATIHDTYGLEIYTQVIEWVGTNTYKTSEARIRAAATAAKNWGKNDKPKDDKEPKPTGRIV